MTHFPAFSNCVQPDATAASQEWCAAFFKAGGRGGAFHNLGIWATAQPR